MFWTLKIFIYIYIFICVHISQTDETSRHRIAVVLRRPRILLLIDNAEVRDILHKANGISLKHFSLQENRKPFYGFCSRILACISTSQSKQAADMKPGLKSPCYSASLHVQMLSLQMYYPQSSV